MRASTEGIEIPIWHAKRRRLSRIFQLTLLAGLVFALTGCAVSASRLDSAAEALPDQRDDSAECGVPSLAAIYLDYRERAISQEYRLWRLANGTYSPPPGMYQSHRGDPPNPDQLEATAFFSEPFLAPLSLVQCEAERGDQFALSLLGVVSVQSAKSAEDRERGLVMLRAAAMPRHGVRGEHWMCRRWSSSVSRECPFGGYIAQWALAYYSGRCGVERPKVGDAFLAMNAIDGRAFAFLRVVPPALATDLGRESMLCTDRLPPGVPRGSVLSVQEFPASAIVLE